MKKIIIAIIFCITTSIGVFSQNIVKGLVVDGNSDTPLQGVILSVKNAIFITKSDGIFLFKDLPNGNHILTIKLDGYEKQTFPLNLHGETLDLGTISLYEDISEDQDLSTITITDDELNDDSNAADNISGLLQSSRDAYLQAAAFEFSSSFFKIRGLDSENGKVLINGIEMNKLYNGRPQWSNWGGLNPVMRNQELRFGLSASPYVFGGVLGTTNINVRASDASKGGSISYASSNRSYVHRVIGTYSSGLMENGWAYTVSASRRAAVEGFNEGAFYDANSFFAAVEKKINDKHSINFTSIVAANERGKSSPNTEEVYDLKGIKYNAYWGYQNGEIRNSRIKRVIEPILMLNHYWNIDDKTTLNTNVAYQFGETGNSRIDYNGSKIDGNATDGDGNPYLVGLGGSNPDPTYYKKLPSYGLREGDANVYELEQAFINDGQLNWNQLYQANLQAANNGFASYVLYEDRNDDKQFTVNSILETQLDDHVTLNASLQYRNLISDNFASVLDLLGATKYLDIDSFGETYNQKQNDLLNPNREVKVGDKFKYDYQLTADVFNGFLQAQFTYNKTDFYLAGTISQSSYQREGFYQNGKFSGANESLGKSEKLSFTDFGAKGGLTYKLTGRHLFNFNAGYLTKAPTIRNAFSNPRANNDVVENIISEKIMMLDASYILRSPIVQAKLTGYYVGQKDATEISFYYGDGIGGDGTDYTAFVQEILTGIDKKHFGAELGVEVQATPTIKLKGAANIGQYTYDNNPTLSLKSEVNDFQFSSRLSNLKNYKLAAGPQNAYSVGFEYRDPNYWWVGATMNFFTNTYVDIAPLTRTSNFYDNNGVPFNDYDPEIAKELLQQEKFDDYNVVNLIGGKSWKIEDYYISLFASVNNLLNTKYKSGGFEQGRNANYRQLREDKALDTPVFGNKYWYGRGTTYFLNLNFRF